MPHFTNSRSDRYPTHTTLTVDEQHTSRDVTPFCEIDADGYCDVPFHDHDGPVSVPAWAHGPARAGLWARLLRR